MLFAITNTAVLDCMMTLQMYLTKRRDLLMIPLDIPS